MHWLPLVAMVIASALPFPHIPVARNVAATTDPGRHLGGRTADADASRGAPSQEDDNTTPAYTGALRLNVGPDKDPSDPSALHPDTSFHSNGEAEKGQLRTSVSASRKDYVSQDKGESEDYRSAGRVEGVEPGLWAGMEGLQGDELFLDAHPRVLFSPSASPPGHPPLLLLESGMPAGEEEQEEQEEEQEEVSDADRHIEGHGDREPDRGWAESPPGAGEGRRPAVRNKRSHLTPAKMGEKAVCDMESKWVMDKKMAIDMHGRNVTIVPEIQTLTGPLKQYFYETRCRQEPPAPGVAPRGPGAAGRGPGAAGRGPGAAGRSPEAQGVAGGTCRGVDKKQWSSQCKARQSYVRALTRDSNNRTGWRWIRIDSSCVCVLLSQANRRGRVEGWRGPT